MSSVVEITMSIHLHIAVAYSFLPFIDVKCFISKTYHLVDCWEFETSGIRFTCCRLIVVIVADNHIGTFGY
jgi:hypothetical protein